MESAKVGKRGDGSGDDFEVLMKAGPSRTPAQKPTRKGGHAKMGPSTPAVQPKNRGRSPVKGKTAVKFLQEKLWDGKLLRHNSTKQRTATTITNRELQPSTSISSNLTSPVTDPPTLPRQRKMETGKAPGENDDGLEVEILSRMSLSLPDQEDNIIHLEASAPVPKPRRNPLLPIDAIQLSPQPLHALQGQTIAETDTSPPLLFPEDALLLEPTLDMLSWTRMDQEETMDFFSDHPGKEISPVEKVEENPQKLHHTTPEDVHRVRILSFFSTPRHANQDPADESIRVVRLNWEDTPNEEHGTSNSESQGFITGSLSDPTTSISSNVKTMDSAVADEELMDPPADLTGVKNRRLSFFLPRFQDNFTPPEVTPAELVPPSSSNSDKADLSWDYYDMNRIPSPKLAAGRRSMVPEEPVLSPLSQEEKSRRKRISLAPCLKALTLDSLSPPSGSPITEDEEELAGDRNETHRMKMPAFFRQRVVVSEDKPEINNSCGSPSPEGQHSIYQLRSRQGLIGMLEERDREISKLKEHIDSLTRH